MKTLNFGQVTLLKIWQENGKDVEEENRNLLNNKRRV